jgi:hypothetical protein
MKSLLLLALCPVFVAFPATAAPEGSAARLHDLFDREWKWRLVESP